MGNCQANIKNCNEKYLSSKNEIVTDKWDILDSQENVEMDETHSEQSNVPGILFETGRYNPSKIEKYIQEQTETISDMKSDASKKVLTTIRENPTLESRDSYFNESQRFKALIRRSTPVQSQDHPLLEYTQQIDNSNPLIESSDSQNTVQKWNKFEKRWKKRSTTVGRGQDITPFKTNSQQSNEDQIDNPLDQINSSQSRNGDARYVTQKVNNQYKTISDDSDTQFQFIINEIDKLKHTETSLSLSQQINTNSNFSFSPFKEDQHKEILSESTVEQLERKKIGYSPERKEEELDNQSEQLIINHTNIYHYHNGTIYYMNPFKQSRRQIKWNKYQVQIDQCFDANQQFSQSVRVNKQIYVFCQNDQSFKVNGSRSWDSFDLIYVIGGKYDNQNTKICLNFQISTQTWNSMAKMKTSRLNPGTFITKDKQFLYAFGGQSETIERYHIETGFTEWEEITAKVPKQLQNSSFVLVPKWLLTQNESEVLIIGSQDHIYEFCNDNQVIYKSEYKLENNDSFGKAPIILQDKVVLIGQSHIHIYNNDFKENLILIQQGINNLK